MVPIALQFRHLLLFKVNAELLQFQCLPFGLCTAPRLFTKVLKPAIELLRTIGIRLVIYMDDILIMASSEQLIQKHTYVALFLLENLGFIVNNKKSILTPYQQIEFLGMTVNSQSMLPGQKIKTIRSDARNLLATQNVSAQSLGQLLGKLNATSPALQMAILFCRSLQSCLKQSLSANSQDYQLTVKLSLQAIEDLQCGNNISPLGMGEAYLNDDNRFRCFSAWLGSYLRREINQRSLEQTLHINYLELLAVQIFTKGRSGISILLRIDNMTAVAYINRKGRTVSPTLSNLAKTLWLWCIEKNISLEAQHQPGVMNSTANRESRTWLDRSERKLSPKIFQRINSQMGHLSTVLFASRLSNQFPTFVSWKPDPLVIAANAFTLVWSDLPQKIYANSPWNLIGRVLSQTCS